MAIEHLDVVELLVLLVNGHERFFVELPHFGADIGALGSGLLAEAVVNIAELRYLVLVMHQFLLQLVLCLLSLHQLLKQLSLFLLSVHHHRLLVVFLVMLGHQHFSHRLKELLQNGRIAAAERNGGQLQVFIQIKHLTLSFLP